MTDKLVLGIDPGLRHTGIAVVAYAGNRPRIIDRRTISPPTRGLSQLDRVRIVVEGVCEYLNLADLVLVGIEEQTRVSFGKSQRGESNFASRILVVVQGAVLGAAWAHGRPAVVVTPQSSKAALTGRPTATKAAVLSAANRMLPTRPGEIKRPLSEHEADAAAVAVAAHAQHSPVAASPRARANLAVTRKRVHYAMRCIGDMP